jgi:hypothetical protein
MYGQLVWSPSVESEAHWEEEEVIVTGCNPGVSESRSVDEATSHEACPPAWKSLLDVFVSCVLPKKLRTACTNHDIYMPASSRSHRNQGDEPEHVYGTRNGELLPSDVHSGAMALGESR